MSYWVLEENWMFHVPVNCQPRTLKLKFSFTCYRNTQGLYILLIKPLQITLFHCKESETILDLNRRVWSFELCTWCWCVCGECVEMNWDKLQTLLKISRKMLFSHSCCYFNKYRAFWPNFGETIICDLGQISKEQFLLWPG